MFHVRHANTCTHDCMPAPLSHPWPWGLGQSTLALSVAAAANHTIIVVPAPPGALGLPAAALSVVGAIDLFQVTALILILITDDPEAGCSHSGACPAQSTPLRLALAGWPIALPPPPRRRW